MTNPILWRDYYTGKMGRSKLTRIHPHMLEGQYLQARNDCTIVAYDRDYAIEKLAYELFLLRFESESDLVILLRSALEKAKSSDPNFEKNLEEIKKYHRESQND